MYINFAAMPFANTSTSRSSDEIESAAIEISPGDEAIADAIIEAGKTTPWEKFGIATGFLLALAMAIATFIALCKKEKATDSGPGSDNNDAPSADDGTLLGAQLVDGTSDLVSVPVVVAVDHSVHVEARFLSGGRF